MSAFEFVVALLKAWQDEKGKLCFEGVAASTSLDRQDERLTPEAMEQMAEQAQVELKPSHPALIALGTVDMCWVDNNQFRVAGSLDPSSSEAMCLYEKLQQGKQYGLSVGGRVLRAHREFDAEVGGHIKYIDEVEFDHIAVCRASSAANPDTYLSVLGNAAEPTAGADDIIDRMLRTACPPGYYDECLQIEQCAADRSGGIRIECWRVWAIAYMRQPDVSNDD